MRAIVLSGFGGLESLVIKELPDLEPKAGHSLSRSWRSAWSEWQTNTIAIWIGTYAAFRTRILRSDWAAAVDEAGFCPVTRRPSTTA